jgi:hypothetical protein
MSPLNFEFQNIDPISKTLDVSHLEISPLKVELENNLVMSVT